MPLYELTEPETVRPWAYIKADLLVVLYRIVLDHTGLEVTFDGDMVGIMHVSTKAQVVAVGPSFNSRVFVTDCRFRSCLFTDAEFHGIVCRIHECVLFYSLPRGQWLWLKAAQRCRAIVRKLLFWRHDA